MIRKLFIMLLLMFGVVKLDAQSRRNSSGFKIALKNNIISAFVNSVNLSLEMNLKGRHAIQGVVQLNNERDRKSSWFMGNGDEMITSGYSVGVEYKYYVDPDYSNLKGWYVSPYFRYIFRNIEYSPDDHNPPVSGPYGSISFKRDVCTYVVIFGKQMIANFGFVGVDVFGGIGIRDKRDSDFESDYDLYPINDFIDDQAEIRFGVNLVLSNVKGKRRS